VPGAGEETPKSIDLNSPIPDPSLSLQETQKVGTKRVRTVRVERPVMILPQVHLRKPCYDFSFL
jgi:hypothetical protein